MHFAARRHNGGGYWQSVRFLPRSSPYRASEWRPSIQSRSSPPENRGMGSAGGCRAGNRRSPAPLRRSGKSAHDAFMVVESAFVVVLVNGFKRLLDVLWAKQQPEPRNLRVILAHKLIHQAAIAQLEGGMFGIPRPCTFHQPFGDLILRD